MTPKERLARIKTTINNGGVYRGYNDSVTPFYDDVQGVEQALNELEFYKSFPQLQEASLIPEVNLKLVTCELQLRELKCDVKRYFDLGHIEEPSTEQFEEYLKLTEKLLKVGNEE